MRGYTLRLFEDTIKASSDFLAPLDAENRVLYVVEGDVAVAERGMTKNLAANNTWSGAGSCSIRSGAEGARLWRWELLRTPESNDGLARGGSVASTRELFHEVTLDPQGKYLMRCDRVDFPLGGVAYTHTHRGPGIRCLLRGEFTVEVEGKKTLIRPGEAWFERGPDPVYAAASHAERTSFVRVMILPAELKGKSSIRYVNLEDRDKPKTQQYTVFSDEFIEI